MSPVVFWQERLNVHEAGYIKALADIRDVDVVTKGGITGSQQMLRVDAPDYGNATVHSLAEGLRLARELETWQSSAACHLFTGVRPFEVPREGFNALRSSDATLVVIAESRDPRGLKGIMRRAGSLVNDRSIRRRADGLLAVGSMAERWYIRSGFSPDRLLPFLWTVPASSLVLDRTVSPVHVGFVGQFIPRKAVSDMLEALSTIDRESCRVALVGGGPQRMKFERYRERMDLYNVDIVDPMSYCEIRRYMTQLDILVLPSRFDGWGAVVNEALLAGCRVLSSDMCGASCLADDRRHLTFRTGDVADLAAQLSVLIAQGPVLSVTRSSNARDSERMIGATVVGGYLNAALDFLCGFGAKPSPPWLVDA